MGSSRSRSALLPQSVFGGVGGGLNQMKQLIKGQYLRTNSLGESLVCCSVLSSYQTASCAFLYKGWPPLVWPSCTMEALLSAVLLSSLLQLCSAAAVLEPLTCSDFNNRTASDLAVHHINEHHRHGYKFRMAQLSGAALEKVGHPGGGVRRFGSSLCSWDGSTPGSRCVSRCCQAGGALT